MNNLSKKGIYRIINNTNNKIYVGSTIKTFKSRFKTHISKLRNNKHENLYLQKAWNKYGENVFKFEIVESFNEILVDDLLKLEEEYILKHNALNRSFGYNICKVGKSRFGLKWSEDSKKKRRGIGNPMYGKGELRKGVLNPMYGKHLSETHKQKMSKSLTGIKKPETGIKLSKPVLMMNMDGNVLNEFASYVEATNKTKILHISEVCNNQRKSAGGYLWKWK